MVKRIAIKARLMPSKSASVKEAVITAKAAPKPKSPPPVKKKR